MKRLIVLMSLSFLMTQVSCGGGGDLEACVSSYVGSLDGGEVIRGGLVAQLEIVEGQGFLTVLLEPDDDMMDRRSARANVSSDDGTLEPLDSLELNGTFDFDSCSISGEFAIGVAASGTWNLNTVESGLF